MPEFWGSTRLSTSCTATAASIAVPPGAKRGEPRFDGPLVRGGHHEIGRVGPAAAGLRGARQYGGAKRSANQAAKEPSKRLKQRTRHRSLVAQAP